MKWIILINAEESRERCIAGWRGKANEVWQLNFPGICLGYPLKK